MLSPILASLADAVPVDDFFGDYVEQLGARGLQQDVPMHGESVEAPAIDRTAMPSCPEQCHRLLRPAAWRSAFLQGLSDTVIYAVAPMVFLKYENAYMASKTSGMIANSMHAQGEASLMALNTFHMTARNR